MRKSQNVEKTDIKTVAVENAFIDKKPAVKR